MPIYELNAANVTRNRSLSENERPTAHQCRNCGGRLKTVSASAIQSKARMVCTDYAATARRRPRRQNLTQPPGDKKDAAATKSDKNQKRAPLLRKLPTSFVQQKSPVCLSVLRDD